MTERDDMIAELRASIGGIDPALDAAAGYAGAIREVQKTVREQGQVTSAALDNNARLWEERKQLRAENSELKGKVASLVGSVRQLERSLAESRAAYAALEAAGGDKWKALYEQCRKTLTLWTSDALDHDQLVERLEAMKRQGEELTRDGVAPAPVPDGEAIEAHMQDNGL